MPRLLIPDANGLAIAIAEWLDGGVVAFPTETVYGLGADATNGEAVARIYALKERPRFNPLIVHAASLDALEAHVEFTPLARELAARFWPGALTLVLRTKPDSSISSLVTAGLDTAAVRVPSHPVARAMLESFAQNSIPLGGSGLIAAPSANPSGQLSATTPKHVADGFANSDTDARQLSVIVGGRTQLGLESTILDLSGEQPRLLRHGAIAIDALEAVTGPLLQQTTTDNPIAPGQLTRHYAPKHPLKLNQRAAGPTEALLQFGPQLGTPSGLVQRNLSQTSDMHEAAANLFVALHEFDARDDITTICVQPIPATGLGLAINDRLMRGAANA